MLEFIELRFKGIGRFVAEQVINIEHLSNFIQIDGQNNNTGGSSGAAKSTVFKAMEYLLGINEIPATILQSRLTDTPIWVQGKFRRDGEMITLTRSKGLVSVQTPLETHTGKQAENQIEQIMGMPGNLFRKVIHKRQKEGGFFLSLGPTDTHKFLMDCTGLSPFKEKMQIVDDELTKLEETINAISTQVAGNSASLSATQDAILSLGLAPIQDIHREVILDLKEKYDRSTLRFSEVKNRCESLDQQYAQNRPSTVNQQYDASPREDLERRSKEIESQIRVCLEEERSRQENIKRQMADGVHKRSGTVSRIGQGTAAKELVTRLCTEVKSIRAQTCPTCQQGWHTGSAKEVETAKIAEIASLKSVIEDGFLAQTELIKLDEEISDLKMLVGPRHDPRLPDLNERLRDLTEKILQEKRKAGELYEQQSAEMKARLDAFVAGQMELRKKHDIDIDQARGQMDVDRRVFDSAVQKLKAYEDTKARYEQTYNELKKREEIFTKNAEKYDSELKIATECQKKALETKRAIKMYISFSFDKTLDAISDKATKIIRCIPNMSNATIQFEGTKETKEGKIKEEVNAVINVDDEIGIPIKSLSGGEGSALDLAVDLAVIDYIESKTGKGMNIFILDEPFNGLGTVEIEMALEVLKNSNTNKKLIIVDHNAEVKEMVQDRVVIVRDGQTSKVQ